MHTLAGSLPLFRQPPILLCFAYFVIQTIGGRRAADVPAVGAERGLRRAAARRRTSAVTAYLLGGTAGIVAGGFFAARTARHDRVAGAGPAAGAACSADRGRGVVPARAAIVPLFALIGFAIGATGPRAT